MRSFLNMSRLGLARGTVRLALHNPEWAAAFIEEKRFLESTLIGVVREIEHIGSTAVPSISAKPILDMLAAALPLADVAFWETHLTPLGYEYRENGSNAIRYLFVKGPEEKRTHHLHITLAGGKEWEKGLVFRDYLRDNPEVAREYDVLKSVLAQRFPTDREAYAAGKHAFIQQILAAASR